MQLTVAGVSGAGGVVTIVTVSWRQMLCKVQVDKPIDGITLDVRTHAGNEATSQAATKKKFKNKTTCSVIVEDEDMLGLECWVVLLDDSGNVIAQEQTTVGAKE